MKLQQGNIGVDNIYESDPKYGLVKPGNYLAIIRSLEMSSFRAGYGAVLNPDTDDGKWDYVKVKPTVQLVNDVETLINSQDFIIGVTDVNGGLVDPSGKGNSLIWSNYGGAFYMLNSIGAIVDDSLDFDSERVKNLIVKIKTFYRGYDSVRGENYEPDELMPLLVKANKGMRINSDDIKGLLLRYNAMQGYSRVFASDVEIEEPTLEECLLATVPNNDYRYDSDENRLFLFNVVVGFWHAGADDIQDHDFWYDNDLNLAFVDEDSRDVYVDHPDGDDTEGDWS